MICVNSYALFKELGNEKIFHKAVGPVLEQLRNAAADGLVTARNDEPNWALAHRILMPAFGPASIRGMMGDMRDILDQLLLKWERFGPTSIIDPTDDLPRLTLDIIVLSAMAYRLNSFYTEGHPPFADAMADFQRESVARATRPYIIQAFMTGANAKYQADTKIIVDLARQIIAERKANPTDRKDLLNAMLHGKDPNTGQGLSDENITGNLVTFIVAGHETTAGTMAFVLYFLVKYPDVMRKLQAEIDEVIGDRLGGYEDFNKMQYLQAVLRETLRLNPIVTVRSMAPYHDTTLGDGKYSIKADTTIACQTMVMQRDTAVWGEDANEFRPERMMGGNFEALPPRAWQPFGQGMRSCLGRPFAWVVMQLTITSILQRFDLSMVDPSYNLQLFQALTIRPKDFYIRASSRSAKPRLFATPSLTWNRTHEHSNASASMDQTEASEVKQPFYVLYGSNTGTSEGFAQRITKDAPSYGFRPSMGTLDSAAGHLPTDGPVIIVTASFEGEPADNAGRFVSWLESLTGNELAGVRYGVFGCGNHDWVHTFQRIPELCDHLLEQRGGNRLVARGVGDAGEGNFFQVFDEFESNLWSILCKEYKTSPNGSPESGFDVKTIDPGKERATTLRQPDAALGRVIENRVLTKPGPIKRHIEFELPEGMTARAGDYLAILPHCPPRDVHRVLSHFSLSFEHQVIVSSSSPTSLPVNKAVTLSSLLSGYVELSQPATTRDLRTLMESTSSETTRAALEDLCIAYSEKVLARRLSILDILETYPDIKVSLSVFLQMLPAMRVRQYSISSSPLWNPQHVTLTISVVDASSISGRQEPFLGVASNYLANLMKGERVHIAVRPSSVGFHPPEDPTVPVVMFCAGSGLAPMRGFIQERAAQRQAGREVSKMLLFFGCRSPQQDYLYSDSDLAEWIRLGVLDVRPAFSRSPEDSENCKYVQDRIWRDRADISMAYEANARFFTCGSRKVAGEIQKTLTEIIKTVEGIDDVEATAKFHRIPKGRYVTDIFD